MKSRCNNPNNPKYSYYGGKGITLCDEWLDFNIFYDWSINNKYSENLTIDRINSNKNYEPSNCRWVNKQIQMLNKSGNKNSTSKYKGVSFSKDNLTNPWRASIKYNDNWYNLGYFATEDAAAIAYDTKAKSLDINFLLNLQNFILDHNAKKRNKILKQKSKYLHLAKEWKKLYNSGLTYKNIAKKYNVSRQTISNIIKNIQ